MTEMVVNHTPLNLEKNCAFWKSWVVQSVFTADAMNLEFLKLTIRMATDTMKRRTCGPEADSTAQFSAEGEKLMTLRSVVKCVILCIT